MQFHGRGAHVDMPPSIDQDVREIDGVFRGPSLALPHQANRPTLTALVQYMAEQDLMVRPPAVEDLFVPWPWVGER
jgi:hypothetical protein